MSLFVKICGIRTAQAADAAAAAGADAVGFVFHDASPRNVEPCLAARLAARLPPGIVKVAVTRHLRAGEVARVLDSFVPDAWQADARDFAVLALPPSIARWPVLRRSARHPGAARVVFDAPQSGRGQVSDWGTAARLARRCELLLAGGLHPGNVGDAIATVRPFGVDVSSGVERRGYAKDPALIRAFIATARSAVARQVA